MLELSMIWGIHNNRNVILHILLCFVVGGRNSEYTDYTLALGMFLSGEKRYIHTLCFGIMVYDNALNAAFDLILR